MGQRFYEQQLATVGTCPGASKTQKRKGARRMEWTDELKQEVVEKYQAENPTPENSMEIVTAIADEIGATPNGVRMILTKAEVYVKKVAAKSETKKAAGGTRVSKADAQAALTAALTDMGAEVDEDIVSKMTGKAAQYFANILTAKAEE